MPDKYAGMKIQCPNCSAVVDVPTLASQLELEPAPRTCPRCGDAIPSQALQCPRCARAKTVPPVVAAPARGASPAQDDEGFLSPRRYRFLGGLGGGILLLLTGALWLAVAIAIGHTFFVPPVLMAIGIYLIIRSIFAKMRGDDCH